jgi:hypothetical protein
MSLNGMEKINKRVSEWIKKRGYLIARKVKKFDEKPFNYNKLK